MVVMAELTTFDIYAQLAAVLEKIDPRKTRDGQVANRLIYCTTKSFHVTIRPRGLLTGTIEKHLELRFDINRAEIAELFLETVSGISVRLLDASGGVVHSRQISPAGIVSFNITRYPEGRHFDLSPSLVQVHPALEN